MKVLFAMGSEQKSKSVADRYYEKYGEVLEYDNVFFFKALIDKVKNNKVYDRIIINEDMEQFRANDLEQIDRFIFNYIDKITDEMEDADIIFICSDRRSKGDAFVTRLFNIGIYNLLIGGDRNINPLCEIIKKPKTKKEAKQYLNIDSTGYSDSGMSSDDEVNELQMISILNFYEGIKNKPEKYLETFDRIAEQYSRKQLKIIADKLPTDVLKVVLQADRYKFLMPPEETPSNAENTTNERIIEKPKKGGGLFGVFKKSNPKPQSTIATIDVRTPDVDENNVEINISQKEEEIKAQEEALRQEELRLKAKAEAEALEKKKQEEARRQEELAAKAKAEVEARKQAEIEAEHKRQMELEEAKKQAELAQRAKMEAMARENKSQLENQLKQEQNAQESGIQNQDNKNNNIIAEIEEKHKANINAKNNIKDELVEIKPNLNAKSNITSDIASKVTQNMASNIVDEIQVEPLNVDDKKQENLIKDMDLKDIENIEKEVAKEEPKTLENNIVKEVPQKVIESTELENMMKEEQEKLAMEQKKIREAQEKLEQQKRELKEEQEKILAAKNQLKTMSDEYAASNVQYTTNVNANMQMMPADYRKMVVLVGANKAGTTFVTNAIAHQMAASKTPTSIIDMTRDKGMYYLYNRDDKTMRKIASECMQRVSEGEDYYLSTDSQYLKVYTATPGTITDVRRGYKHKEIIDTVTSNCNITLVDADFTTPLEYFEKANEIYIVQDLDVLKIQEVTLFLRELKNRNIDMKKIKVIINQYIKTVFTPKHVLQGLSYYNDPEMSFVDELLPSKISYAIIPYNLNNYAKYIECLFRGKVNYKGFSADFCSAIDEIASMMYPRANKPSKRLFG